MYKKLFIILLILSNIYGKKDFYYSYVDPELNQISQAKKQEITDGNNRLQTIKRHVNEGQLDIALKQITFFRNSNKIPLLDSNIILLNSEILYKLHSKMKANEASDMLEAAIHDSKINQDDLLQAYRLLVLLKIRINKAKEAEYYAKAIEHSFDDPLSKVYSKVASAQIHIKKREYRKAIKILRKELVDTTSLEVATIIADELYDAYILNKENDKAYELVEKVLGKNIDYYANDSYKALHKVDKLVKAKMSKFAIKILKKLLNNASQTDSIDNFKFILANTYMLLGGYEKEYIQKAKKLYEELIAVKNNNPYLKKAKMILDEIIMREGKFDPVMISSKYSGSESMQFKTMMQELLNAIEDKKYAQIIKMRKIYNGIPVPIINRFGYDSMEQVYNMVNSKMIKYYLTTNQCQQLNIVIKDISDDVLLSLVEDKNTTDNLFGCLLELPHDRTYKIAKNVYSKAKNSRVYLYLEQVALLLKYNDDAFSFSQKLEMINDSDALSDEFLYRFLIYGNKNSSSSMQNFFRYARQNQEFIKNNENNPLIIDFYYQFYLYLLKENEEDEALTILYKLYKIQNEMNARVYSPFVEIELAKWAKLDDNYEKSLKYLKHGLNIKRLRDGKSIDRKIKKADLAHIYYEMTKIYEYLGKKNKYKTILKKCKNLKNIDTYYKKMCDRL